MNDINFNVLRGGNRGAFIAFHSIPKYLLEKGGEIYE